MREERADHGIGTSVLIAGLHKTNIQNAASYPTRPEQADLRDARSAR